ncbi:MAG: molybdenum cofactor biosynthesis protein MoaE [Pseudomonadota bacterium]
MLEVRVTSDQFDPGLESKGMVNPSTGALVVFQGIVRDDGGDLLALELEHYPAMTKKAITTFCETAKQRWSLTSIKVIHRYGRLAAGETIMMVATASAHRRDAFEAADFLMDYLKSRAPFWKKEHRTSGTIWVSAKSQDEDDLRRWA